jgi:hypothetical protein
MRYMFVPTISFTDLSGVTRSVKAMREYPAYVTRESRKRIATEPLDYIAQLADVYGEGNEGNAYFLWEANIALINDCGFDLTQVQALTVPVQQ